MKKTPTFNTPTVELLLELRYDHGVLFVQASLETAEHVIDDLREESHVVRQGALLQEQSVQTGALFLPGVSISESRRSVG